MVKAVWQATASVSLRMSAKFGTMGIELELAGTQKLTEFSSAGCAVVAGLQVKHAVLICLDDSVDCSWISCWLFRFSLCLQFRGSQQLHIAVIGSLWSQALPKYRPSFAKWFQRIVKRLMLNIGKCKSSCCHLWGFHTILLTQLASSLVRFMIDTTLLQRLIYRRNAQALFKNISSSAKSSLAEYSLCLQISLNDWLSCSLWQGVVVRPKFSRGGHVFEVPIMVSPTLQDYKILAAAYILPPTISLVIRFCIVKPLRRHARRQKVLHPNKQFPSSIRCNGFIRQQSGLASLMVRSFQLLSQSSHSYAWVWNTNAHTVPLWSWAQGKTSLKVEL